MTASYVTSLSCSQPTGGDPIRWLGFVALSPCPQHLLFSTVDILLLSFLLFFALQKLLPCLLRRRDTTADVTKPFLAGSSSAVTTRLLFKLSLALASVLAVACSVLLVLAATRMSASTWRLMESIFVFLQFKALLASAAVIAHEKRFRASVHPLTLRIYWLASFVLTSLFSTSSTVRLTADDQIAPDDYIALILLPISIAFLFLAVNGSTSVFVVDDKPEPDRTVSKPEKRREEEGAGCAREEVREERREASQLEAEGGWDSALEKRRRRRSGFGHWEIDGEPMVRIGDY